MPRIVPIDRVEPEARLARDARTGRAGEPPLLRRGAVVTERAQERLARAGITALYVDDELGEGIDIVDPINEETRLQAERALARAHHDLASDATGRTASSLHSRTLNELEQVAIRMREDIVAAGDAVFALADPAAADAYALQHPIDVAALGLVLGRRLFREHGWIDYRGERSYESIDGRLVRLGLGLLLIDIGNLAVPDDVLKKGAPLEADEWDLVRSHTVAGAELLPHEVIGPIARAVVKSHHERWDGRGYPEGRVREKTHQFARIAAVADTFDAVTSARPFRPAAPQAHGVAAVRGGSGTVFDPEVVDVFLATVAPYPPGTEVALTDGSRGVVADVNPRRLSQPVVRVGWNPDGGAVRPYEVDVGKGGIAVDDSPALVTRSRAAAAQ